MTALLAATVEYWADWFWRRAGGRGPYPVDIGYAATCALEVSVHRIAGLTSAGAAKFIRRAGTGSPGRLDDRPLHGCIVVGRGGAMVLVDRNDDERQARFTIAHEVAHFIVEVRPHVERAAERLGPGFIDVLYGSREPTESERIDAWLNNARSDPLIHFMDRASSGAAGCRRVQDAECAADRLALEILAPRSELRRAVRAAWRLSLPDAISHVHTIARQRFGLPDSIAERYASRVVWELRGGPSTAERFGFGDGNRR